MTLWFLNSNAMFKEISTSTLIWRSWFPNFSTSNLPSCSEWVLPPTPWTFLPSFQKYFYDSQSSARIIKWSFKREGLPRAKRRTQPRFPYPGSETFLCHRPHLQAQWYVCFEWNKNTSFQKIIFKIDMIELKSFQLIIKDGTAWCGEFLVKELHKLTFQTWSI